MSALETRPSKKSGQAGMVALFVIYLVLLVWIVLWKLQVPYVGSGAVRELKLIPFAPSAEAGASAPVEIVANLVLFVPFGLYLGLLTPRRPWWKAALTVAGASLVLETAQYVLAVGSTDVTDVVLNTAGGLTGFGLCALARRRFPARTPAVARWVCLIGTVLALIAVAVFVALPLRYAQPR